MYSSILVGLLLVLIECITGVQCDERVIIGSSVGGVIGLIILILDIIAIFELLMSSGLGMCSKLLWILIILFFPIGGLVLYWCCVRRRAVDQIV